ncbi:hypothetical protein ABT095_16445 [Kitasatospora sp. NPDC002227]|uniref:hypothetical protein n=1 Tax=Kitasatospora sp. NPDC002227 TaxID=3154773 RepID=UPI00331E045A
MTTTSAVLTLQLHGGRWDGLRKPVHAAAPPLWLRLPLRPEPGAQRPSTSVYRLDGHRYRHCHDE